MSAADATFEELVAAHRRELFVHCYRLLGSVHDAEDALQEALLAAWRGLSEFGGRSSLRTWLYTIATNACLRLIERRPVTDVAWLEPLVEDPADRYARRETVERAGANGAGTWTERRSAFGAVASFLRTSRARTNPPAGRGGRACALPTVDGADPLTPVRRNP